jgi:hypothetical protein
MRIAKINYLYSFLNKKKNWKIEWRLMQIFVFSAVITFSCNYAAIKSYISQALPKSGLQRDQLV